MILILAGDKIKTQKALCELRLEMGSRLGLRDKNIFAPLWVIDFPLFEWDEETQRFYAMHHPFTSPKPEDIGMLESNPGEVRANAYDMVINGVELGGGLSVFTIVYYRTGCSAYWDSPKNRLNISSASS